MARVHAVANARMCILELAICLRHKAVLPNSALRFIAGSCWLSDGSASMAFTKVLRDNEIAISMDGRGSWRDNVFVERLWRSLKYEEVYLRALRHRLRPPGLDWPLSGLLQRPPATLELDRKTPDTAYFNALMPLPAAA